MTVAALAAQAVLAAYLQIVEWVDLFPWNDLRGGNEQRPLDVAIGVAQVALIVGSALGPRWVFLVAVGVYAVWLALQAQGWWKPYFRGASARGVTWYDAHFRETTKLLPRRRVDHPPPDANHLVLQLLIVATLALCAAAYAV